MLEASETRMTANERFPAFAFCLAIDADAVARAIAFAVEQPADVDVNELVLRPTRQEL